VHYFHSEADSNSISHNRVWSVCEDKQGYFWIGTNNGLNKVKFDNNTLKIVSNKKYFFEATNNKSLSNSKIRFIYLDKKNNLWVGTQNGLNKYIPETDNFERYFYDAGGFSSLSLSTMNCAFDDKDNNFWVGTLNGLVLFDRKSSDYQVFRHNPNTPTSINSNDIRNIFQDRSGAIWVSTRGGGINKINGLNEKFTHYLNDPNSNNSLSNSNVWSFFQDTDSILWIGTSDGLNRFDRKNNTFEVFLPDGTNNSLSDKMIYNIKPDKKGNLWLGTNNGLNKFNVKTGKVKVYQHQQNNSNSLSSNYVWSIFIDSKGLIWCGTFDNGGLNCLNPETEEFTIYKQQNDDPESLSNNMVRVIFEDSKGNLWIGTADGLNLFSRNTRKFKVYKKEIGNPKSLINNSIWTITEDSKKNIWIGTYGGGLSRLERTTETFIHYTKREGLTNNIVYGILEDDLDNLWISTNKGLSKFNTQTQTFINYDARDGLQSNEFHENAYYKTQAGELFFGGINGFNCFLPESFVQNNVAPNIVITNFKIFNTKIEPGTTRYLDKTISHTKYIELDYTDYSFSIEFAALHFYIPSKNVYLYKLEGFEEDWIETDATRRFVTYTNIAPGKYFFRVRAANSDGIWNLNETVLQIVINPPFWETWWFYTLLVISALIIIYLIILYRTRKLESDRKHLNKLVAQRTYEIEVQKKEIEKQRDEITFQRDIATNQRDQIAHQNNNIKASIYYSKRIQTALLPPNNKLGQYLSDFFVLDMPRDIVSGDFYWITQRDDKIVLALADCTGHGVPGAFMSILGIAFLNEEVNRSPKIDAAYFLESLRTHVITSLHQTGKIGEARDGMDIGLCVIDKSKQQIQFAGAYNSLIQITSDKSTSNILQLFEYKGDKMPIGILAHHNKSFTNHIINYDQNDIFYLSSDGYVDQFGGSNGRKFLAKSFRDLLLKICTDNLEKQRELLSVNIKNWIGTDYEQIDDILVLGFKVGSE